MRKIKNGFALYLAMALLSLKLWQLADLAGPLVVILGAQTLTMALYAAFVTFRVMGKNYATPSMRPSAASWRTRGILW